MSVHTVNESLPVDDVPDLDFGEGEPQLIDEKLCFNKKPNNFPLGEDVFRQRAICLLGNCKQNVEKALSFLGYIDLLQPRTIDSIEYLNHGCTIVTNLLAHYEYRLRFLKTMTRDYRVDEIYREIVKLGPHQLEQVTMYLNLCESRLRDYSAIQTILSECHEILSKRCECCGVTTDTEITNRIAEHAKLFASYIYSLKSQQAILSSSFEKLESILNETVVVVTACFDTNYSNRNAEHEKSEANRAPLSRRVIFPPLH